MTRTQEWQPTACILCSCNCGIEVQTGGDCGRHIERIRGDRSHPVSRGYLCQKANRLDHYQNNRGRLLSPMRRRADGSYEEVDWSTAIAEVAARLDAVRREHSGRSILYFGGGGQGNHLCGGYASATRRVLGSIYRSNALAQEKTGEIWVAHQMFGGWPHGSFDDCEVGIFLGKNPWQSHGIARARVVLRELSKDPDRALVVIDPARTESADLADYHLRPRPGTDAWLLTAMLAVLVEEDLVDREWLDEHATGLEAVESILSELGGVAANCRKCGVDETLVREVTRRIARAKSVSVLEDLGVQMNRHSTLVSYLQRLVWLLAGGNFGCSGGHNFSAKLVKLDPPTPASRRSPVTEAPIIAGLVPCNSIAEEILSDHPDRFRAMICESANPAHSLADSPLFRQAMEALDFSVVIDVAMTETARCADYVLPAALQYEKAEATFFNSEFPDNAFHLRHPLFEAPEGALEEAEIHCRIVEALGEMPQAEIAELRGVLERDGRLAFGAAFTKAAGASRAVRAATPLVLYRTLGESLPKGMASAASLWGIAHQCAQTYPKSLHRAGIEGEGAALGEALFEEILSSPRGFVFAADELADSWSRLGGGEPRLGTDEGKVRLDLEELFPELRSLATTEPDFSSAEFPLLLSAGERRSYTANTINRDPGWRKSDSNGALRVGVEDATDLGLEAGAQAQLTTERGSVLVEVEVSDRMMRGHISLPNGLGLDYPDEGGEAAVTGAPPNELTSNDHRDWLAGTPWHKSVPARLSRANDG